MSAVSAASSPGLVGFLRCVDRCCPKTRHASRSETPCLATTSSTHARRRVGLRSFPVRFPLKSTSRLSDRRPLDEADCFRLPALSGASLDRPSGRRILTATGNMSLPSRLSIKWLLQPTGPVLSILPPAATWRQSLQVYVSSCSFFYPP